MTLPGIETVILYAKLAIAAALLALVGWQYVALNLAEKTAQEALAARDKAVAQAQVLSDSLARQNAAVATLGKKLAAKRAEVASAQLRSDRVAAEAAVQLEALRAEPVPEGCEAAVRWLGDKLRGGQ